MNICFFTRSTTAHRLSGGMETQTQILAEGLKEKGSGVTIITTSNPRGKEFETVKGVEIFYLKNTRSGIYSKGFFIESSKQFEKLHKKLPFSIVVGVSDGSLGYALRSKKRLQVPLVVILHGTLLGEIKTRLKNINSFRGLIHFVLRILPFGFYTYFFRDLRHLREAEQIIAVSEAVKKAAQREYFIDSGRVSVVLNGIDVNKFKIKDEKLNIEFKNKLGFGKEEKVLLFLGRLEREKGVYLLLESMPRILAKFEKIRLLIVGEGPEKETLRRQAREKKIDSRVSFIGNVSYDDAPKYYNIASVFVFPTLRYEGFPMTIIEAMACGKPVIASKMGGISEVVEDGITGILIEPGSLDGLTEGTLKLLADATLLARMSRKTRGVVEAKFSQERMVGEALKVLRKVYNNCYKIENN